MVPLQGLSLEQEHGDDGKDRQGDDFLDDLELHEVERASVLDETDPVGGYLGAILEKRDTPGEEDDAEQRPALGDFHFLQFEVAVPGQGHESVGDNEQGDSVES